MTTRTVSTLKFVGSISLGLLTGVSYTLSTLTIPTLLTFPSAATASRAYDSLVGVSTQHLRVLASVSSSSFLIAYLLSPGSQKHPYLLWTSLFVATSGLTEFLVPATSRKTGGAEKKQRTTKPKGKQRQMDASYEVLGHSDRESEGVSEADSEEEIVNGEEIRGQMEGFMTGQMIRTVIAGLAFGMSVVGIWGDGAADLVIIEM